MGGVLECGAAYLFVAVIALVFIARVDGAAAILGGAACGGLLFSGITFAVVILVDDVAGVIIVVGADSGVTVITGNVACERCGGEKSESEQAKRKQTNEHYGLLIGLMWIERRGSYGFGKREIFVFSFTVLETATMGKTL